MTQITQEDVKPRDPVLDYEVTLNLKVEDVNVLLATLAKLPYETVAPIIGVIREDVIKQVQAKTAAANPETPAETESK